MKPIRPVAAVAVALAFGLAAACGGGDASTKPTSKASTSTGSSLLTGKPGVAGRVLAVKIDNVGPARPATGLDGAAVVYAIQVEGGLSRLLAVYDAKHLPPVVGPVRSARETDLRLLPQYGHPALAFSGAQSKLLPVLRAHPRIETVDSGYYRSRNRHAPHNEYLRTTGAADKARAAADIGFRFGPAPAGGDVAWHGSASFPAARFFFEYHGGGYEISMDGVKSPWKADNVIVQDIRVRESRFKSRTGFVPFSETVGAGDAVAYRDGRSYSLAWSRASEGSGTVFTLNGRRYHMKAGNSWIILR